MTAMETAPQHSAGAHRVAPAEATDRRRQFLRAAMNPTLLFGIVAPFVVYELLSGRTSVVTALAVGAVFPAAATLWTLIRTRRPDPIALMTLGGIILGLIGALIFDSPLFLLLKESVVTGTIGLVFLGSLLAARPLTFVLARSMMASTPAQSAALEASWDRATVRAGHRRTTIEWGTALVVEAGLRAALAFVLTPGTLLFVSPFLTAAVIGPVAIVTFRRRRRAAARLAEDQA
ncbi:septation protein IspZ [Actinomycetospora endophytica]|uniref:Septation protein IspZ n=1 Tax=Actinomycetospora endophytica TaxID=2291215 RepID=A0ABS8PKB5_9PSEU|nr:VC0807 family protein [Actinomycetospora endophytica]MCD2197424.1 septation protein IspZ [Actinomycetospora endophytica]